MLYAIGLYKKSDRFKHASDAQKKAEEVTKVPHHQPLPEVLVVIKPSDEFVVHHGIRGPNPPPSYKKV
jgi:hypothetical protein